MRKLQILCLALFAVFALGAVMVAPALAEENMLWLLNGTTIEGTTKVPTEIAGSLLLTDLELATEGVTCAGIFDGTVSANGADETTAVLTSTGELLEGTIAGQDLLVCTNDSAGPCEAGEEIDVETVGLPWATQLVLVEGLWLDLATSAGKKVGYMVTCLTLLGAKTLDECTVETAVSEIMSETSLIGLFNEENTGNCSLLGGKKGDVVGEGLVTSTSGTITVSEP